MRDGEGASSVHGPLGLASQTGNIAYRINSALTLALAPIIPPLCSHDRRFYFHAAEVREWLQVTRPKAAVKGPKGAPHSGLTLVVSSAQDEMAHSLSVACTPSKHPNQLAQSLPCRDLPCRGIDSSLAQTPSLSRRIHATTSHFRLSLRSRWQPVRHTSC